MIQSALEEILSTWQTHAGLNHALLDHVPEGGLAAVPLLKNGQPSRGRTVARVLAHLHDVRVAHLPAAFRLGARAFAAEGDPSEAELRAWLMASDAAVAGLLEATLTGDARVRNPKRCGAALLGYLISHESHHRGQIMLALKQRGFGVPEALRFGLWAPWFADGRAGE